MWEKTTLRAAFRMPENGRSVASASSGHALVGGAAHDVRVRALVDLEFLLQVSWVGGQAEAELPVLGALVGEKTVERVHEHPRNQLPHDRHSIVSGGLSIVLATGTWPLRGGRLWPVADPRNRHPSLVERARSVVRGQPQEKASQPRTHGARGRRNLRPQSCVTSPRGVHTPRSCHAARQLWQRLRLPGASPADIYRRRRPHARMVGPLRPTRRASCSGRRARRSSGWRRSRRRTPPSPRRSGRACGAGRRGRRATRGNP